MAESREREARALDDALLAAVRAWHAGSDAFDDAAFTAHALALFAHQARHVASYRGFAASFGYDDTRLPERWRAIPAVPSSAFKDATLASFDVAGAELAFHTSGTTAGRSGVHHVERAALYDAALLAAFDRFVLPDRPRLRYLNVVPDPRTSPHSSLGYMMGHLSVLRGDGSAVFALGAQGVDVAAVRAVLREAERDDKPLLVAGTAFGLAALLDAFEETGERFALPAGSRLMETGGFKGRHRVISRAELYARLQAAFGLPPEALIAEYGMTELLSQYYDAPETRGSLERVKIAPPWLRSVAVDARGAPLPDGERGFLRHVDLANRSSVLAIETEDVGRIVRLADGRPGLVLEGRAIDAAPRGCSLDAEALERRTVAAP